MSSGIVEKLAAAWEGEPLMIATGKRDVFATLDRIRSTVDEMEDFTTFPEGSSGAILFALLKTASETCPDAGDFGGLYQGYQAALSAAFKVLRQEIGWSPEATDRSNA
jgi:hypothetical protein